MHASWATYFKGLDGGLKSQDAFQAPPIAIADSIEGAAPVALAGSGGQIEDHMKVSLSRKETEEWVRLPRRGKMTS